MTLSKVHIYLAKGKTKTQIASRRSTFRSLCTIDAIRLTMRRWTVLRACTLGDPVLVEWDGYESSMEPSWEPSDQFGPHVRLADDIEKV